MEEIQIGSMYHVVGDEKPQSIDWSRVESWRNALNTEQVALHSNHDELSQEIIDGKEKEIENLVENKVFQVVPIENQVCISSRWVVTEKLNCDGKKMMKAHLVAKGYEEDSSNMRTDSLTCSHECFQLLFTVVSCMGWQIHSIDITIAFLQGSELEHEIFQRPPPDVCSKEFVWSLKRCIYGLNDAPHVWYERIHAEFKRSGGVVSTYDNACSFGMMTMKCLLEFLLSTLMILHLLEAKPFTLLLLKSSRRLSK